MKRFATPALAAIVVVFLCLAPQMLGRGSLNDLWFVFYGVILASGWNILGGMAGQVSFGYSVFVGIGAYTTALMSLAGYNPFVTLPVGALIAAAFSVLIGLPTFRLRGPYFSIATIGVSEAVRVYMTGAKWSGGSSGKRMPPGFGSFLGNYYSMLVLCLAVLVIVWLIGRSRFGLALRSIKQDIDAAEALGVNSTWYKVAAHGLSAALVAMAGSLFAINFQYIAPETVFAFTVSLQIVLMPVIGGIGTLLGPVIGGVVFQYLQIKLLGIPALRNSHLLIYGLLLIVVMLFEPGGVVGLMQRLWRWISGRGAKAEAVKEVRSHG